MKIALFALLAFASLSRAEARAEPFVLPPDFWTETSRTTFTTNAQGWIALEVAPGGYAISDYIPGTERLDALIGNFGLHRLWYDADFNLVGIEPTVKEGAYYRVYVHRNGNRRFRLSRDPREEVRRARENRDFDREYEIVLKPGADATLELAAKEIARHAKLVTGRDYAIVPKPTGRPRTVLVGRGLSAKDGDIVVTGTASRDVLFAACRFVEDEMGVLWLRPDPTFGTIYTPRPRLDLKPGLRTVRSVCDVRAWGGPGGLDYVDTDLWWARNGATTALGMRDGLFGPSHWWAKTTGTPIQAGGSCFDYIRPHLKEHPDLQAIVDGQRPPRKRAQICFTHPDAPRLFAESAKRFLAEAPEGVTDDLSAVLEDSWACCECDRCMKDFPRGASRREQSRFRSTQYFSFLKKALAEVRKFRPKATLTAHAYIFAAVPPSCDVADGVYAEFCPYPEVNLRFPIAESKSPEWVEDWNAWLTRHGPWTTLREYYFTSAFAMFAEPCAANLRALVKHGGHTFYSQSQPDRSNRKSFEGEGVPSNLWDANAADQWLICRLLQDPSADVAKLRDDYLRRAYPTSHAELAAFYRLFARKWFDPSYGSSVNCHTRWGQVFSLYVDKAGIETECRALLQKAEKKERNPNAKKQIGRMLAMFDRHGATLGRASVAAVPEVVPEWRDPTSTHWLKATALTAFKRIYTNEPVKGLEVRLGYWGTNLYYRTSGEGAFVLSTRSGERGRRDHVLARTGVIPLAAVMYGDGLQLAVMHKGPADDWSVVGTETFDEVGWPVSNSKHLSPFTLEALPKPGIVAWPEKPVERPEPVLTGDLYGAIRGFQYPVYGCRWTEWKGKRLFDTGYGSISYPVSVSDAKDYVVTVGGHHYGGYLALYIRFLDAKGREIKLIQEKGITEEGTDVRFRPPKGCTALTLAPYDLILTKLEIKEVR